MEEFSREYRRIVYDALQPEIKLLYYKIKTPRLTTKIKQAIKADALSFLKFSEKSLQKLPDGRPVLTYGHISMTHSAQLMLVAFHPSHRIGVDVQYRKSKKDYSYIGAHLGFDGQDTAHLLKLWCCYESGIKVLKKLE